MTTLAATNDGPTSFLKLVTVVSIVGAINWGLIGVFNWNLVDAIFGGGAVEQTSMASRIVYAVVGIAGLIALFLLVSRRVTTSPRDLHRTT
jgi:uncharacterized membrane protein YuzA (DUF378 family)